MAAYQSDRMMDGEGTSVVVWMSAFIRMGEDDLGLSLFAKMEKLSRELEQLKARLLIGDFQALGADAT